MMHLQGVVADKEKVLMIKSRTPMRRIGKPEEVSGNYHLKQDKASKLFLQLCCIRQEFPGTHVLRLCVLCLRNL